MNLFHSHDRDAAFTLPDLLAVLAMLITLTLLALPAAANNRGSATAAACLGNLRQLTAAWQLYATDNDGRLVHNFHGGDAHSAGNNPSFAPWAMGWETWGTDPDNTNTLFIRNPRWARLSPYLNSGQNVHKCPSDIYLSQQQSMKGWKERVRSYSMNITLGHVNFQNNLGPWNSSYAHILRTSDLRYPSPAESFVFLDEHPDSMNDVAFFPPNATSWVDIPGNLHSGAGTFSFADGHVELHSWITQLRSARVTRSGVFFSQPTQGNPDIHWVSYHSQRVSEKSY